MSDYRLGKKILPPEKPEAADFTWLNGGWIPGRWKLVHGDIWKNEKGELYNAQATPRHPAEPLPDWIKALHPDLDIKL